ncbi:MAG: heavy metal-binding domain-containing protein [Desulfobacterales bacterium]|nr:heavy metal-binding domain-containing protein [Desulfobacterales bacterium]MDX2510377.1 heavy metal-binding domain-containing protein [Desulfobacterales bacterium]
MEQLIVFLFLLALGYTAGTIAEKSHYRSIEQRERDLLRLPAITMKQIPYSGDQIQSATMVHGSVVISVDYFKRLLAKLRNIFGGTVKSYESLADRARREAILRMKEMAGNATIIVNVRIETATIGKNAHRKGVGCMEAVAYGTAVVVKKV